MEKVSEINRIPQVDKLLRHPLLENALVSTRREVVVALTRAELESLRQAIAAGKNAPGADQIASRIVSRIETLMSPSFKRVVNATGVVLNTNLGRAPLARESLESVVPLASNYMNLEIDLDSGKRGKRSGKLEELLSLLTGCQSAVVVNNNAAALLLAVNTLARRKEVVVSRGELIEIGGSFRLPEVIVSAGGLLKEVGTTNRTRLSDFESALSEKSGLFMKCHRSNFSVSGFTEDTDLKDLVALSMRSGVPLVMDLGSGALVEGISPALAGEPTVETMIASGCSLVAFSADKLLGGPQAGIVAGEKALVDRLRKNPLYRALRCDKLTLATLEQVLLQYLTPSPEKHIPVLSMLALPATEIEARAKSFADLANRELARTRLSVVATGSKAGGGSMPERTLESFAIRLATSISANRVAQLLRRAPVPVIAVVKDEAVMLDFRTIKKDDERDLLEALRLADRMSNKTDRS